MRNTKKKRAGKNNCLKKKWSDEGIRKLGVSPQTNYQSQSNTATLEVTIPYIITPDYKNITISPASEDSTGYKTKYQFPLDKKATKFLKDKLVKGKVAASLLDNGGLPTQKPLQDQHSLVSIIEDDYCSVRTEYPHGYSTCAFCGEVANKSSPVRKNDNSLAPYGECYCLLFKSLLEEEDVLVPAYNDRCKELSQAEIKTAAVKRCPECRKMFDDLLLMGHL